MQGGYRQLSYKRTVGRDVRMWVLEARWEVLRPGCHCKTIAAETQSSFHFQYPNRNHTFEIPGGMQLAGLIGAGHLADSPKSIAGGRQAVQQNTISGQGAYLDTAIF